MLTEAPVYGRSGPLYLAVVSTVTRPDFGVLEVAKQRGRVRGPVGVENARKPSLSLKFAAASLWLTADWGPAPHMQKAAFVS